MEQSVAIRLIEGGVNKLTSQLWADLGAGSGVFTRALATVLGKENTIYAIDKNESALNSIESNSDQAIILKMKLDFITYKESLPLLDGIIMANSLHYVQAKEVFISNLRKMLKPDGRLLIIEYDTLRSNQWVPYPIDFTSLTELVKATGFASIEKLTEHPSQFRQGNMYSALVL